MDPGKYLICTAVAFVATDWVKTTVTAKIPPWAVQVLALIIAIGTIFLVGATVWAHTQVIGGHALDNMNTGSKIVAGLLTMGGSTLIDRFSLFESRHQTVPPTKQPSDGTPTIG